MYQCPHCDCPEIPYLKKWWSCSTGPTKCSRCEGLSYVPDVVSNGIFSLGTLSLILTVIIAISAESWLVAGLGFLISIACYMWLWHVAKMRPTTAEQATSARNVSWGMLLMFGIVSLFS